MLAVEAIAEEIARQGVREVFTYMSRDIIKLMAELSARGITIYQARHEHGAVGMADGYARATGRVAVVLVGAGVGLTNGLNALITAAKAHSRVLLFVGEVPGGGLGTAKARNATKYVDQRRLFEALAIRHVHMPSPESSRADIRACFELAERGGEVLAVSLPSEVLDGESGDAPSTLGLDAPGAAVGLSSEDQATLVEILEEGAVASRTVILAGRGAVRADAGADLMRLGEATGALLATSVMARELFASSPYYAGISGTFSTPLGTELLTSATLVLAFGASLNYYTTYLGDIFGKARVVQIDNRAPALGKYQHVDIAIEADARVAAAQLADELERKRHHVVGYRTAETAQRIAESRGEARRFADRSSAAGMDPRTLMRALDDLLPKDRTLVVDVGHFMDFPIAHMSVPAPRAFVWPIEYTAVGSGLGPALGAAVAHRDRLTVLFIGDGGMMMTLADLHTAVRYQLRLLIVVCNDSALSGELHFLRESGYGDELARSENPSFEAIARGIGFEAATITSVSELDSLRGRLSRLDGPMLLDCRITPEVVADSRNLLAALIRTGVA